MYNEQNNNSEFTKAIQGKRVIFVGPSRTLTGSRKAKWINSFDFVVRTNGAFPVSENNKPDFGWKCDGMYVNASYARMVHPLPVEEYEKLGVKFLSFKAGIPKEPDLLNYNRHLMVRSFLYSGQELKSKVKGLLSGSAILNDILKYKPKEFWVTGLDFYMSGQWHWQRNYIDNYLPEKTLKQAQAQLEKGGLIGHDIESNKKYMVGLYKAGKIKLDDDILKILGLYRN